MFKSLHHIAIICSDIAISKQFYIEKLGFTLINETLREERKSWKVDLILNDIQLELFTFPDAPTRATYPEAIGFRHIAFGVENIEEIKNALESKNITVEDIRTDEITGKKYTFFPDPDNLPLELYEI